jgi:hypothetical protein
MTTSEEIQMGRAKNAVLSFLEDRLIVPKIYLDADWDGRKVDVLAIERDGVGDVHAVLLFANRYKHDGELDDGHQWEMENKLLNEFANVPAQYKYIGVVDGQSDRKRVSFLLVTTINDKTFAPDGLGRTGFLQIDVTTDGESQVKVEIKPERFRAKIAKLADEYVQQHEADWEIRA